MNLGDDLFLKDLCFRYQNTNFYIISNRKVSIALEKIPNLTVLPNIPVVDKILEKLGLKFRFNNLYQRIITKFCDGIVHIGGSIFKQGNDWKEKLSNYKKRIIPKKPYYIIGSNFGPFNDDEFYKEYTSVFENVTDVCFRENYSYNLFKDLPNVRQAPDVIFQYPNTNKLNEKKQVTISVINLKSRKDLKKYKDIYHTKIKEIIQYYIRNEYKICLMGFCNNEGDNLAIEEIYDQLCTKIKDKVEIHNYKGNIDESLQVIKESEHIIATRFHSMILGWIFDKKVFPLVYDKKMTNVLSDINYKNYIKINDIDSLTGKQVYESLLNNEKPNISKLVKYSNYQYKKLDEYLKA